MSLDRSRTLGAARAALGIACIAFAASAHAVHTCTVGIGNLSFGAYTGSQITSSTTMTITCTLTSGGADNVDFTATLSTGAGSYVQRRLTHVGAPPDTLPYNLYLGTVPAILNTNVWGDGSGGTVTASGTMQLISSCADPGSPHSPWPARWARSARCRPRAHIRISSQERSPTTDAPRDAAPLAGSRAAGAAGRRSQPRPGRETTIRGFNVIARSDGDMSYAAVSDTDSAELARFAAAYRGP